MNAPLVSVIMPTYNQAWYLRHALDSIAAQTFRDFELIVVDDGSTDYTRKVIADYPLAMIGRHQYVMGGAENRGTAEAINTGIDASRGQFVTWVSSDNLMHPRWLEALVGVLQTKDTAPRLGSLRMDPPWPFPAVAYAGFWWASTDREGMEAFARFPPGPDVQGWDDGFRLTGLSVHHCRPKVQYLHEPYSREKQIAQEACYLGPAHLIRREVWAPHTHWLAHDLGHFLEVEERCWAAGLPIVGVDEPLCMYFAHDARRTITDRDRYDAPAILEEARRRRAAAAPGRALDDYSQVLGPDFIEED